MKKLLHGALFGQGGSSVAGSGLRALAYTLDPHAALGCWYEADRIFNFCVVVPSGFLLLVAHPAG